MTPAYRADALIYDAERDGYALCPDFDPNQHCVDIDTQLALGWPAEAEAGWNHPEDPPIAQVRDMACIPVHAGHAYVVDRFDLADPSGKRVRVDLLAIDHDPVGFVVAELLEPGIAYPLAAEPQTHRAADCAPPATGFGPGTMIATRQGELPVEWLTAGDEILTFDSTSQPLRWVGHSRLSAHYLARHPMHQPVCMDVSAVEKREPAQRLILAPETQILLSGPQIALNFGLDQALARAGDMLDPAVGPGLSQGLTYFMLLFDRHQVVRANGQWCASLFADAQVTNALAGQRAGFPTDIRHDRFALACLKGWEVSVIRDVHARSEPQLIEAA